MVHLYGVAHGTYLTNFLTGRTGEIRKFQTEDLIMDLSGFPEGTNIGIECLNKKEWEEVIVHLGMLPFNPPEPRFEDEEPVSRPHYGFDANHYWNRLEEICLSLGFNIVYLEDKNLWFRYNEKLIKLVENEARRRNLLVIEEGESDEEYARKRIGFNIERHKENILVKRIHEIERDSHLLRAITSSGIDVACVGIGHSDYWMTNPQTIKSDFGLKFESYSSETPDLNAQSSGNLITFVKNAKANPRNAFGRQSLERSIKLLETGRLKDGTPDFIETWDIHNPLQGYFEMFIERNGKEFNGEIIDCLGDANVEGVVRGEEVRFVKKYKLTRCSNSVSLKEIIHKGILRDGKIIGYFATNWSGKSFYATAERPKNFVDLSMSWEHYARKHKEELELIGERLFDNEH